MQNNLFTVNQKQIQEFMQNIDEFLNKEYNRGQKALIDIMNEHQPADGQSILNFDNITEDCLYCYENIEDIIRNIENNKNYKRVVIEGIHHRQPIPQPTKIGFKI